MTTNTGNSNVEQLKTIVDIAKEEAKLAEDLDDESGGAVSKAAAEKAKKEMEEKEKEKEETIMITRLEELPTKASPYKRESKKSYKLDFKDISYEFFGNGKTKIIKGEKTETEKTKKILIEVEKRLDEQKKEEESKKATEQAKIDQMKEEKERIEKEKADKERAEKEKIEKEKTEKEKIEKEKTDKKNGNTGTVIGGNNPKTELNEDQGKTKEEVKQLLTDQIKQKSEGSTDATGNIALEANYEMLELTGKPPVAKFKENGKRGLIDIQGKEIIKPIYESITFTKEGNIACKLQGRLEVFDRKGEMIDSIRIE